MMKIGKHIIPHQGLGVPVNVPLARDARVLCAAVDGVRPVLYVVEEGEPCEPRWFQMLWTADPWPDDVQYIGTVRVASLEGGAAVWHVVEHPQLRGKDTPF